MAGRGPAPKPAHLRQRRNKKAGAATLSLETRSKKAPELLNPDGRTFHPLTLSWWGRVWSSPMAGEYLPTDVDGLARLAILVDEFYKKPDAKIMQEIRLQEARFGLSPVDRSRLQWEVERGEQAERKRRREAVRPEPHPADPRGVLGVVPKSS